MVIAMARERIYNFAPGPSVLPLPALERAQAELLDYGASGMSVMEMSHRSAMYQEIIDGAREKLRRLMSVPESHEILFMQGGGTAQFAAVPMNLIGDGSADYAVTGNFSAKAAAEARKYGGVCIVCDTSATGHDRIPEQRELELSADARYFYYCANNTIYGTEWQYVPQTAVPLVCDMSSDILTRPVDFSRYALVFAGAQKNMAPAGLTVVIVDKSAVGRELEITPQIMSYKEMLSSGSMLNTPPCWCIYMLGLTLDWLEAQGGVAAMDALKRERAGLIYDHLDNSRLFKAHARPGSRSWMNICFRTGSEELDAEFVKGAAARGLINLKGHRLTGGMRASMYNALPLEGAAALRDYMKEFEREHHV